MTDNDRRWAALVKAIKRPSEFERADRVEAKLCVFYPITRELFDTLGPDATLDLVRDRMVESINNAIEKVREAIK